MEKFVVLVVGSGCRECAIIKKLIEDTKNINLEIISFTTTNNPYLVKNCHMWNVDNYELIQLENFINNYKYLEGKLNYAIIGPEAPLENGYADLLQKHNIPCLGPTKIYAQIETSKIFTREFLQNNNLGHLSPKYDIIDYEEINNLSDIESKYNYINKKLNKFDKIVVKKDGLCGGKGVTVQDIDFSNKNEFVIKQIEQMNENSKLLIEEKLEGEEFSLMSISDGTNYCIHFPPIQDYKRLNNHDKGPNTGGMGCVIDKNNTLEFLNKDDIEKCKLINTQVINYINQYGKINGEMNGYTGVLYGSYIKTKNNEIYIIEYNSRFGDPESVIALELLQSNFYEMINYIINKTLNQYIINFSQQSMLAVYLVPKSYPSSNYEKYDIYLDKNTENNVIYGNVELYNSHIYSLKSRSLIYFSKNDNLYVCFNECYNNIKKIRGNFYYRSDIGSKFLSNYEKAGVSINNGNQAVSDIKEFIKKTYTDNVVSDYGSFGGEFKLGEYTLVTSIDGVGTKSVKARKFNTENAFVNLGKDIVNHSINDILVQGAYPLFFLDYFGTFQLDLYEITQFVKGVSEACVENGPFPLLGGETAEMPSIYRENQKDLVGCIVGLKNQHFFKHSKIEQDNMLIGFESSGPHTNGYSLINKIIDENDDKEILQTLFNPHRCYLNEVKEFVKLFGYENVNGMCHITGGGFDDNILRVIPKNLTYQLNELKLPEWCEYLMNKGNISLDEMKKVFNCGIGYVIITNKSIKDKLEKSNLNYIDVGFIKNI